MQILILSTLVINQVAGKFFLDLNTFYLVLNVIRKTHVILSRMLSIFSVSIVLVCMFIIYVYLFCMSFVFFMDYGFVNIKLKI